MKTPTQYVKMLNNNVITNDIVGQVLYSYNKRAKNYRDKKRQYKNTKDHYGNYEKNEYKEKEFYKKKEDILKLYNPIEIHKNVKTIIKRKRIYDYEYHKYNQ